MGSRFTSTRGAESNNGAGEAPYQPLPSLDVRPSGLHSPVTPTIITTESIPSSPLVSVSRPSGVHMPPLFSKPEPGGGDGGDDNGSAKKTGGDGDGFSITGVISYMALYISIVAAAWVANSMFFSQKKKPIPSCCVDLKKKSEP
jgi:hypothetical protein